MLNDTSLVAEKYLLKEKEFCQVCNTSYEGIEVCSLQNSPRVTLKHCPNCRAYSASRFPTQEYLKQLYDPSTYSSSLVSEKKLSERCATRICAEFDFSDFPKIKILDYGGSEGTLSKELIKRLKKLYPKKQISSTVVDLFLHDSNDNISWITPSAFQKSNEKFNLLIASAVIEHLPNVFETMSAILKSRDQIAFFYARTPYDYPVHRILRRYTIRWPRHLHDFGPDFWSNFSKTFKVKLKTIKSQPSIVETTLKGSPIKTFFAYVLKSVSYLEINLIKKVFKYSNYRWHIVGGWEVYLKLE